MQTTLANPPAAPAVGILDPTPTAASTAGFLRDGRPALALGRRRPSAHPSCLRPRCGQRLHQCGPEQRLVAGQHPLLGTAGAHNNAGNLRPGAPVAGKHRCRGRVSNPPLPRAHAALCLCGQRDGLQDICGKETAVWRSRPALSCPLSQCARHWWHLPGKYTLSRLRAANHPGCLDAVHGRQSVQRGSESKQVPVAPG
jgi:hypothetical protein